MGKILSWVLLFVTFFFAVQALLWNTSDMAWNSTYLVVYCIAAGVSGVWTTVLSPRTPVYDLVRYFLIAVLVWMAFHVSVGVMIGIIVLAVLLLPFVILDFQGRRKGQRDELMLHAAEAVLKDAKRTNRHIDTMSKNFDRRQRRKAAKRAAKEAENRAANRAFEWTAGWYWK